MPKRGRRAIERAKMNSQYTEHIRIDINVTIYICIFSLAYIYLSTLFHEPSISMKYNTQTILIAYSSLTHLALLTETLKWLLRGQVDKWKDWTFKFCDSGKSLIYIYKFIYTYIICCMHESKKAAQFVSLFTLCNNYNWQQCCQHKCCQWDCSKKCSTLSKQKYYISLYMYVCMYGCFAFELLYEM